MKSTVTRSRAICASAALLLLASACAQRHNDAYIAIPKLLHEQADAWNRGDVESFMQPYWHSDKLTFVSGGDVTTGWQATLDRYLKRYPTKADMGELTFSDLRVRELSRRVALVFGRWHLERQAPASNAAGRFTLILQRIHGQWTIIHDHTSTAD